MNGFRARSPYLGSYGPVEDLPPLPGDRGYGPVEDLPPLPGGGGGSRNPQKASSVSAPMMLAIGGLLLAGYYLNKKGPRRAPAPATGDWR